MITSAIGTKPKESLGQPQLLPVAETNGGKNTATINPTDKVAGMRILWSYTEETFLVGRNSDLKNGILSRVSIRYKQSGKELEQIEISAGNYGFCFKITNNTLRPKAMHRNTKRIADNLKDPKPGEAEEGEHLRKCMLALIGYVAKRGDFGLVSELKDKVGRVNGLYVEPYSEAECFSMPDVSGRWRIVYTKYDDKNEGSTGKSKGDISIVAQDAAGMESEVYMRVPVDRIDHTLQLERAPFCADTMMSNGDHQLNKRGHAAMRSAFALTRHIMDNDELKLECVPNYPYSELVKQALGLEGTVPFVIYAKPKVSSNAQHSAPKVKKESAEARHAHARSRNRGNKSTIESHPHVTAIQSKSKLFEIEEKKKYGMTINEIAAEHDKEAIQAISLKLRKDGLIRPQAAAEAALQDASAVPATGPKDLLRGKQLVNDTQEAADMENRTKELLDKIARGRLKEHGQWKNDHGNNIKTKGIYFDSWVDYKQSNNKSITLTVAELERLAFLHVPMVTVSSKADNDAVEPKD